MGSIASELRALFPRSLEKNLSPEDAKKYTKLVEAHDKILQKANMDAKDTFRKICLFHDKMYLEDNLKKYKHILEGMRAKKTGVFFYLAYCQSLYHLDIQDRSTVISKYCSSSRKPDNYKWQPCDHVPNNLYVDEVTHQEDIEKRVADLEKDLATLEKKMKKEKLL